MPSRYPKTHEEMVSRLIDHFEELLAQIKLDQENLEKSGRTYPQAKFFRTQKTIRKWLAETTRQF